MKVSPPRNITFVIIDADNNKLSATELKVGHFYRVVESKDEVKRGALACRTGKESLGFWTQHRVTAYSASILEGCTDTFVAVSKFSIIRHTGKS